MKKKIIIGLAVIALIITAAILFRSGKISFDAATANALSAKEVDRIVANVKKHIRVPDEDPLIALITDIDSLVATQAFYSGAENGDVLIVYPSVSKAILYSPDDDVLINVGPVVFDENTNGATVEAPAPAPAEETPDESKTSDETSEEE